jgi:hypothetical protein
MEGFTKKLFCILALLACCIVAPAQVGYPISPNPFLGAGGPAEILAGTANNMGGGFDSSATPAVVGSDGFLRFVSIQGYTETAPYGTGLVVYTQCTNANCTASVSNTVYTDTPTAGCMTLNDAALTLDSSGFARIAVEGIPQASNGTYNCPDYDNDGSDAGAVVYIQCSDIACAGSTQTLVSIVEADDYETTLGIAMQTNGTTADIIFNSCGTLAVCESDSYDIEIQMATCSGTTCSAPTTLVGPYDWSGNYLMAQGAYVGTDDKIRFAYVQATGSTGSTITYYYYNGTGSAQLATYSNAMGRPVPAMTLTPGNLAVVAWALWASSGTQIVGCTDVSCSTNDQTSVSENLGDGSGDYSFGSIAVSLGANGAEILREGISDDSSNWPGAYDFIACGNAPCTSYTLYNLQSAAPLNGTTGQGVSILASSSTSLYAIGMIMDSSPNPPWGCQGGAPNTYYCNGDWVILFSNNGGINPPPTYISYTNANLVGDTPTLQIPVLGKAGETPFSFNLIEAPIPYVVNSQWLIPAQMVGVSSPALVVYAPIYPAVAQTPAHSAYVQVINDTKSSNASGIVLGTPLTEEGWSFTDSSYVAHFFGGLTGKVQTPTVTNDGSGYTISTTASNSICSNSPCPTVTDAAGNTLIEANQSSSTFDGVVAKFTDPSGVSISASAVGGSGQAINVTDTLGTKVLMASETNAGSLPPNGTLPTNTYAYTGPSGTENFVVTYGSFTQETDFGCTGITDIPATPVFLPIKVALPDLSTYLIGYETTPGQSQPIVTGRLASVKIPTGATITYSYSGSNNGMNCTDGSVPTLQVTTPDGTTKYVHTP